MPGKAMTRSFFTILTNEKEWSGLKKGRAPPVAPKLMGKYGSACVISNLFVGGNAYQNEGNQNEGDGIHVFSSSVHNTVGAQRVAGAPVS